MMSVTSSGLPRLFFFLRFFAEVRPAAEERWALAER